MAKNVNIRRFRGQSRDPSVIVRGKLFTGVPTSAIMRAAKKAQNYGLTKTRERSRIDTGLMKRSWYSNINSSLDGVELTLANDVFYTKFQEYGTRNIRPMHAATRTMPETVSLFKQELAKELGNALGGAFNKFEQGLANVFGNILNDR